MPLTKGLHTLLFDSEDKIDNKGIKIEDIITRDEIYKDIEVKPGLSRRAKNIYNYKNYLLSNQQSRCTHPKLDVRRRKRKNFGTSLEIM